jgi:hypothetical protein
MSHLDFVSLPGEIRDYVDNGENFHEEDFVSYWEDESEDESEDDSWDSHPSLTAQERNPGLR